MKTIFKLIPIFFLVGLLSACGNDESTNDSTDKNNKHATNKSDSSKRIMTTKIILNLKKAMSKKQIKSSYMIT